MEVGAAASVHHQGTILVKVTGRLDRQFSDKMLNLLACNALQPRQSWKLMRETCKLITVSVPAFLEAVFRSLISEGETSVVAS